MSAVDQVLTASRSFIDGVVATTRAQHPNEPLAVLLERNDTGRVRGKCTPRSAVVAKFTSAAEFDPSIRRTILTELADASSAHIPVVVLVYDGPRVELGIVRLTPPTPKPPGLHVDDEQTFARHLAEVVAPRPGETVSIWRERAIDWAAANPRAPHATAVLERSKTEASTHQIGWPIAWGANACPRVVVPHKLAANLMATNCGDDPAAMTCAPWSAYMIEIPPELVRVEIDSRRVSFDVISVWRNVEGLNVIFVQSRTDSAAFGGPLSFPVPDFDGESPWSADDTAMKRATECLQRLVIGVELEMSDPSNVKKPRQPSRKKGAGTGDRRATSTTSCAP